MYIHIDPTYSQSIFLATQKNEELIKRIEIKDTLNSADIVVGSLRFLNSLDPFAAQKYQILLVEDSKVSAGEVIKLSSRGPVYVVDKNKPEQMISQLEKIDRQLTLKSQAEKIRNEIQVKRRELEKLNLTLSTESEKKIKYLEQSHVEETEKNQNEKSLLHFLDFIQSESVNRDFLEKLFRFLWKDLKKLGRVYTIGISNLSQRGKSKMTFYDGMDESTSIADIDFAGQNVSKQLAHVWGRPVGRVFSWKLPEFSRESFLFLEFVDQQIDPTKIQNYITERLPVMSLYFDRWLIESETQIVVDRWTNTFKSFSGFTHLIDDEYNLYHANYPFDKMYEEQMRPKCYSVLAHRSAPCVNCPLSRDKAEVFQLKEGMTVRSIVSQFKFEDKKYYFVIYEDVTKIISLQTQLIQTEKMSTLGRIGNHLAHELNNPLTGIKSYVQTLLEDKKVMGDLPSTAQADLNEVLKATNRCQKIIRTFIDFSQNNQSVLEVTTFAEVLQNTLLLLKSALRNHRIFVDLKNDIIRAHIHDLQQVLFNIIKNSCQAMTENGSIKIYQEEVGNKIHYHIEDSGPGFSPEILKSVFQPFMTTKPKGEGTGLGLYLSKKLVNNMKAEMLVSSSPRGAKVTLVFEKL